MKVILDTVAIVRGVEGKIPPRLQRRLQKPSTEILISIVSPWEIAAHPSLSKLLDAELVESIIASLSARILPITMQHTKLVRSLPKHHSDPFDRMIIAQALQEDCPVVSPDQRFPNYETAGLQVLWD